MRPWTDFLPDVTKDIDTLPEIVATNEVVASAIELCERTKVWLETLDPVPMMQGVCQYDFEPSNHTLVQQIMRASLVSSSYGAVRVEIHTPDWCSQYYPGWELGGQVGTPCNVTQIDMTGFYVVPSPQSTTGTMVLRVALKPTRDSLVGPEILWTDCYEAVLAGAKARIFAMAMKPWSNPALALAYGQEFDALAAQITRRQEKAFGRAQNRVRASFL